MDIKQYTPYFDELGGMITIYNAILFEAEAQIEAMGDYVTVIFEDVHINRPLTLPANVKNIIFGAGVEVDDGCLDGSQCRDLNIVLTDELTHTLPLYDILKRTAILTVQPSKTFQTNFPIRHSAPVEDPFRFRSNSTHLGTLRLTYLTQYLSVPMGLIHQKVVFTGSNDTYSGDVIQLQRSVNTLCVHSAQDLAYITGDVDRVGIAHLDCEMLKRVPCNPTPHMTVAIGSGTVTNDLVSTFPRMEFLSLGGMRELYGPARPDDSIYVAKTFRLPDTATALGIHDGVVMADDFKLSPQVKQLLYRGTGKQPAFDLGIIPREQELDNLTFKADADTPPPKLTGIVECSIKKLILNVPLDRTCLTTDRVDIIEVNAASVATYKNGWPKQLTGMVFVGSGDPGGDFVVPPSVSRLTFKPDPKTGWVNQFAPNLIPPNVQKIDLQGIITLDGLTIPDTVRTLYTNYPDELNCTLDPEMTKVKSTGELWKRSKG